jgi:NTP pyrophosphatase (non-canonical NTP hydrolase)
MKKDGLVMTKTYHKIGQGQQDEIKVRTMDWATYQDWTKTTAVYPEEKEEEYLMVGLANEVGELLGKYKKEIRGDGEKLDDKLDELGDVCWYIARLFDHYGVTHQQILHNNAVKLIDRQIRGKLKGDGDKR